MKEEALELANELVIASSEMEYNHIVNDWKLLSDSADMIRKLVAELDKQGEPVALCCDLDDYRMVNIAEKMGLDPADKMFLSLPLYTAPQTKPLSDEEIYKFAENCGFNIDGKAINDGIETAADFSYELFKFARAIEERHGIK